MKKKQQSVSRHDRSSKSGHGGSCSPPILSKEKHRLSRHHSVTGNPRNPPATQSTAGRRPRDDDERSEDSGCPRTPKFPRIEDITDLVQKRLNQTGQQFLKGPEDSALRISCFELSVDCTDSRSRCGNERVQALPSAVREDCNFRSVSTCLSTRVWIRAVASFQEQPSHGAG